MSEREYFALLSGIDRIPFSVKTTSMKNMFKGTNGLEKIGVGLLVHSVVFMIIHTRLEAGTLASIMEQHQLFFWLGLALWAIGYMMREQAQKKQDEQD